MVENKFPEDFPAALQVHPVTKEKIKPRKIMPLSDVGSTRSAAVKVPEFVREKNAQLGITQNNPTMLIEEAGWRLNATDTSDRGLVISSIFFQDVFFIFDMHVPWLAAGTPKIEHQYFCKKDNWAFVYVFADGF